MAGQGGKNEVEQAVEMFHAFHVRQFVQSVTQAAENLHNALEQIKSSGLPVPAPPTPAALGLPEGFPLPEAVPMSSAFATPTVSHGTAAENILRTPIASRSTVSSPRAAAAATVANGGVLSMAGLQMLLSAGTPPASPAGRARVMDPGALGSALAALTQQPGGGSEIANPLGAGGSNASWGPSGGTPGPSPAQTAAAAVAALRTASEDHAGPSTPAVQPGQITQALTPMSKRKREMESLFSEAKKPSPALPPSGQRRKVRVVQGSPWPEKGGMASLAQTAVWNSAQKNGVVPGMQPRPNALAAVAAAAARAEEADGSMSTGERTASHGEHSEDEYTLDSRHLAMGCWTEEEKRELIQMAKEAAPCGSSEWEALAAKLTQPGRGGASAERMYRSLTDPSYQKSHNPHGRRINPRKGSTPMHVMATYALQRLPELEGNLSEIGDIITANEEFAKELDWSPRPGTKTYPRWKDALVGCFKPGRYPHLVKTDRKKEGLTVYRLETSLMKSNPFSTTAGPEAAAATT